MKWKRIKKELVLKPVRSSGPGGQHVNKVATKISLRFDINASEGLSGEEKEMLIKKLESRLTKDHILIINSEATRSQYRNRAEALAQLKAILKETLKKPKKRKATKPTKGAVEKRLRAKRKHAEKKERRKDPGKEQ